MPVITPAQTIIEDDPAGGPCGAKRALRISDTGGLTQFGAYVEILPPGSSSAIKHWHSNEDEVIYVLDGEVTLTEGTAVTVLRPGDGATFKAGDPVGHFLTNRSAAPTRCLIVGTRAAVDTCTYPDHDRVPHRDRSKGKDTWTDFAGKPAKSAYDD